MRGICAEAGCPHPPTYRGRCRTHARAHERHAPGRLYDRRKWKHTRRRYLFEHPICEHPECNELATDVHHLQKPEHRPDLAFSMDNLQALCHPHHSQLTRREMMA